VARFSEAEKTLIWDWWRQGGSMRGVARELGRSSSSVRTMIESHGGVRPVPRCRNVRHLSLEEREEISRGMASGESLRSIAVRLGRSASTVSREVAAMAGGLGIGLCVLTGRPIGGLEDRRRADWRRTRGWL
jgi:DNA-binding NarL/FixJ family response regulator